MVGSLDFELKVLGEVQLKRRMQILAEGVKDFTPAWDKIEELFNAIEEQQFVTEGQGGWKPLSPAYAKWKRAHYPGKSILQREGDLFQSMTGGAGSIREKKPLSIRLGTSVSYALFHQKGTSRMPARKVVDLTDENKRNIMREIQRYIVSLIEEETQ